MVVFYVIAVVFIYLREVDFSGNVIFYLFLVGGFVVGWIIILMLVSSSSLSLLLLVIASF